jgi:hypothetical protein
VLLSVQGFLDAEESSGLFNPFAKKQSGASAPETAQVSSESDSAFPLPSLPKPKLPKFRLPKWSMEGDPAKPSTWDKVTSGTKGFFAKTRQVLMPWSVGDKVIVTQPPTGSNLRTATRPERDDKPKSLIPSWLQSKPEEKPVESVNDFLSLPSPRYH